jgi:hypothetical protein
MKRLIVPATVPLHASRRAAWPAFMRGAASLLSKLGARTLRSIPLVAVAAILVLAGCDDSGKKSEQVAVDTLATISALPEKDVAAVRDGLPEGAKFLAKELPTDPGADLKSTQEAIKQARENTDKLRLAKSNFFVYVNPEGRVVRSEYDPDDLVDTNVFASFPDLKKALEGKGVVEAFGEMKEMRGVKRGEDMAWVAATAVPDKEGKARGVFASGWSFRSYAYYLEQQAKRFLDDRAKTSSDHKIPVMYVYVVKGAKAYGAPDTPDENASAIGKLDLPGKVKSGSYRTHLQITGRTWGVAADACKALGDDAAIAVAASVY